MFTTTEAYLYCLGWFLPGVGIQILLQRWAFSHWGNLDRSAWRWATLSQGLSWLCITALLGLGRFLALDLAPEVMLGLQLLVTGGLHVLLWLRSGLAKPTLFPCAVSVLSYLILLGLPLVFVYQAPRGWEPRLKERMFVIEKVMTTYYQAHRRYPKDWAELVAVLPEQALLSLPHPQEGYAFKRWFFPALKIAYTRVAELPLMGAEGSIKPGALQYLPEKDAYTLKGYSPQGRLLLTLKAANGEFQSQKKGP